MCFFSQGDTSEKLQCPAESKRGDIEAGYHTLVENKTQFKELCCVPISVNVDLLDIGAGIKDTLRRNKAC